MSLTVILQDPYSPKGNRETKCRKCIALRSRPFTGQTAQSNSVPTPVLLRNPITWCHELSPFEHWHAVSQLRLIHRCGSAADRGRAFCSDSSPRSRLSYPYPSTATSRQRKLKKSPSLLELPRCLLLLNNPSLSLSRCESYRRDAANIFDQGGELVQRRRVKNRRIVSTHMIISATFSLFHCPAVLGYPSV